MKNIATIRFAFAASLLAAAALSAHAQVSLRTVVDLAQRNSATVKLADADLRKAQAGLSESKDVIYPSILFNTGLPIFPEVGFTGQPPSIWSATVQSLVFSIPQKHYIDAAHSSVNATTARVKDAREQAALDAASAYIELDTVNQELAVAKQQQQLTEKLVEIEQQRAEAGVDPLVDLHQAQLTAALLRQARLHLETRAATLDKQLSQLTGLPTGSILPDHASIPEIPAVRGDLAHRTLPGIEAARLAAESKQRIAHGDRDSNYYPQLSFFAQYNRNTTLLNNVNNYFARPLPANNFAAGISISVPLFDMVHRAKANESAAEALRARVEAEQADQQNDLQIAELTGSLRELDTQAEIAGLKQQIAADNLKTVDTQLENGSVSSSQQQLSPRAGEQARIDERQKYVDSLEAGFQLDKARLDLLRALGHMEDWLAELHAK